MRVMNRAGQDSCSYQGDEMCPLHHFLKRRRRRRRWILREVKRSKIEECKANSALT